MREINVSTLTDVIERLCIDANEVRLCEWRVPNGRSAQNEILTNIRKELTSNA